jgi:hypothetical protein
VPLVRISLIKGKPAAYVRSIADGVHQALVETYDVPENDRFQLIQQHDRDEFLYDPDYLNIHRTHDAILINIVASGRGIQLPNKPSTRPWLEFFRTILVCGRKTLW